MYPQNACSIQSRMPCAICKKTGHNKNTCQTQPSKELSVLCVENIPSTTVAYSEDVEFIYRMAEEVYSALGAGHTESVYHNAMKIGLQDSGLKYETERDIVIKFRERYVGTVRADLIVEGRLVIELKASMGTDSALTDAEEQCRIYMKETRINYGAVVIFPKRVGGKLIVKQVDAAVESGVSADLQCTLSEESLPVEVSPPPLKLKRILKRIVRGVDILTNQPQTEVTSLE